jgi:hypothetical protein
MVPEG